MVGGVQHRPPKPKDPLLPQSLHCVRTTVDSLLDDDMLVSFRGEL